MYPIDRRPRPRSLVRLRKLANEAYARIVFRGVRRDAPAIDDTIARSEVPDPFPRTGRRRPADRDLTAARESPAFSSTGKLQTPLKQRVDHATASLGNLASKKAAEWAGWSVIRQNRRFFPMRRPIPPRRFPFA